jgi:hypothetical protein
MILESVITETGRLLRVLLIRLGALSADSGPAFGHGGYSFLPRKVGMMVNSGYSFHPRDVQPSPVTPALHALVFSL